jgi:hypothetical protein
MNQCAREVTWAGGVHVFNLNDPRVLKVLNGDPEAVKILRTRTGVFTLEPLRGQFGDTPAACFRRFQEGVYSLPDIERVLLYGLWGGGIKFGEADALVEEFVRNRPIHQNAVIAFGVLADLFVGASN